MAYDFAADLDDLAAACESDLSSRPVVLVRAGRGVMDPATGVPSAGTQTSSGPAIVGPTFRVPVGREIVMERQYVLRSASFQFLPTPGDGLQDAALSGATMRIARVESMSGGRQLMVAVHDTAQGVA